MRKMIELVMILAVFAAINAADNVPAEKKQDVQKQTLQQKGHVCYNSISFQAEALAKQGKDEEAIKMYEDAKANPDYEHHWQYLFPSLEKLYKKTKQYDKCIALWNDGHKKNMVFDFDLSKEEYKPFEKVKGFAAVVKKNDELKKAKAVPQLKEEDCEGHEKDEKKETK